jgi:hypothetical protein
MPGGDGFFPPVQYAPWWMLIGVGILILVALWYVFVLFSTRRRPVPPPQERYAPVGPPPQLLRHRYLGMIQDTQAAHESGRLSFREAHHQLSLLLRSYVAEREGIQTIHMTLEDLRDAQLTPLSAAVERLYPGAFSDTTQHGTVADAAADARRLVESWR